MWALDWSRNKPEGQRRRLFRSEAWSRAVEHGAADDPSPHGPRRAAERTGVAPEVAQAALAHTVANKAEAAYRRSDLFEKRRLLMQQWGAYCGSKGRDHGPSALPGQELTS
jgi:integrase